MPEALRAAAPKAVDITPVLSDAEFARFQRFIFDAAGITLGAAKKPLVTGRLGKRLAVYGLSSYAEYFRLLSSGQHPDETQMAVDLLTTNETYFFREAQHFERLREHALAARQDGRPYRVWSAASSSGEEAYSIAMVLAECLGGAPWEVLGTDISLRVLQDAVRGLYTMERARHLPPELMRRHCLKGTDEHAGRLMVRPELRARVSFGQVNLNEPLPALGRFDFVFLRNVMIYFSDDTKRQVVARVVSTLAPGGCLCVGHSESLNHLTDALRTVAPSMYCLDT
ncbi:protein-glutamate O-methyltransferase CheR [Ideonella sp. A 288]|uniref:CheR family methyltransferase n=1 Tax=Ideonella sp. A 288 TaxID=1962181 RepID=UPI000B4B050F|nr:CheR family methyltransferase [Ideonella sp. A 288]